ncbi:unnamed protein product [Peronospora belbahrii]|uniref:Peptidase M13 N-terminal domain-containing protein n=1 Tax=Peronospora belbahrii TaxID=622444 RepID=A0AAU9KWL7_9STRA|nr:unnamed protein product [Peronospora belbahrii]
MKQLTIWKQPSSYDEGKAESSYDDDDDAHTTKQKPLEDEKPLVYCEDESMGCTRPPPLLMQHPIAAWALGSLGVQFVLVVSLVVPGGTMRGAPSVTHLTAKTNTCMAMLPSEVRSRIDETVDPCCDFYAFCCGAWLKIVKILVEESRVILSLSAVEAENEKVLIDMMHQGWLLLGGLYESCMNVNNTKSPTADDVSIRFLSPVLEQIAATKTKMELSQLAGALSKAGPNLLTNLYVSGDDPEVDVYVLYASQTGLSMPGPEYYLDRNQFGSTRDAFHAYVMELFRLVGLELRAAASRASAVVAFEQTLAPLFEQEEQSKDSAAPFSRMSVAQAASNTHYFFHGF